MMGGRAGRGERWQFRIFDHQLRLFRSGTLSYLERYRLDPSTACLSHPWAAADAGCNIGTLLRAGHGDNGAVADLLHTALAELEEVRGSADVLDRDLLLERIAAAGGVAFRRARRALAETLPSDGGGSEPVADARAETAHVARVVPHDVQHSQICVDAHMVRHQETRAATERERHVRVRVIDVSRAWAGSEWY